MTNLLDEIVSLIRFHVVILLLSFNQTRKFTLQTTTQLFVQQFATNDGNNKCRIERMEFLNGPRKRLLQTVLQKFHIILWPLEGFYF